MTERVQYLIAQYEADPLRKEPRNVGIIARMGGRTLARFMGEREDGRIDGRELRWMSFPEVYRQWVFFWREAGKSVDVLERLLESNKGNYGLVRGGKVFDTGDDRLEQVVDYLYSRFVGGGFAEAMREEIEMVADPKLTQALSSELANLNLLAGGSKVPEGIVHPVEQYRKFELRNNLTYKPEFSQENGAVYIMQTFDFVRGRPKSLYEHAGLSAYLFQDMKEHLGKKVDAISVVKTDPEAEENEDIANSKAMLQNESRLVDWNDAVARKAFLEERRQVAVG